MKVILTKNIKLNGIEKKEGTILDVTNGMADELISKKKARLAGNVETVEEKEFKKVTKKAKKNVDENNETNEENN